MRNSLDYNSTPLGALSTLCDLILLNLLFLLCCLPVVTIGPAICGMYHINLRLVRGEEGSMWQGYWQGFRENFRQGLLFWLLFLAVSAVLAVDYWILPIMLPGFYQIPRIMVGMVFLAMVCWMLYVFPVITRFVCTFRQVAKNAVLMLLAHFPVTLGLLVVHAVFPLLCLTSELNFMYIACLFLVCGFSLVNLAASYLLHKVLMRYETV